MHLSACFDIFVRYIACIPILDLSALPVSNDPTAVLAHSPGSVTSLPVTVFPIPFLAEAENDVHATQRIFVAHQGRGLRWYKTGGRTRQLRTAPRMIEMYEQGQVFDHCRWENVAEAGRCVLIEFDEANVSALTQGESRTLIRRTEHEVFDDRISRLSFELAHEALHGMPNGHLYAQGLAVSLIAVLASRQGRPDHVSRQAACRSESGTDRKTICTDSWRQQSSARFRHTSPFADTRTGARRRFRRRR